MHGKEADTHAVPLDVEVLNHASCALVPGHFTDDTMQFGVGLVPGIDIANLGGTLHGLRRCPQSGPEAIVPTLSRPPGNHALYRFLEVENIVNVFKR